MLALAESLVHAADLGVLNKSAGRTDAHALAALDAGRAGEASVLSRGNESLEPSVLVAQDAEAVRILAARDAAAAEDALGCVSHETRSELIEISLGVSALVSALSRAGLLSDV